jgi:hypothetical protein
MTRISQALTRRVRLKSNLHRWFHPLKGFILLLAALKRHVCHPERSEGSYAKILHCRSE